MNNIQRILCEFREQLDEIMLKAMHSQVLLYGYESYTGRFIKWYAEYYHNIDIAWLVSTDMGRGRAYDQEIFRPSVIEFGYKNVRDAVVWMVEPMTDKLRKFLESYGYEENKTYFDFYKAIYGKDIYGESQDGVDVFHKKKEGRRDIQFLEWLEWKYNCNFVTRIPRDQFAVGEHNSGYGCSTQKEIFTILDKCHCKPKENDAIFDYGCGKGGALVSFMDYGFDKVGGVEYVQEIYDVLCDNIKQLSVDQYVNVIRGDAAEIKTELDSYNWFYFYAPFDLVIRKKCLENIIESCKRKKRKVYILYFCADNHSYIEDTGYFRLVNQFTIDMRQRVVAVYESK